MAQGGGNGYSTGHHTFQYRKSTTIPQSFILSRTMSLWLKTEFQYEPLTYAVAALKSYYRAREDVYAQGDMFVYYRINDPSSVGRSRCVRGSRRAGQS